MRNKKNVPAIRFRGFSCDWKSRRFDKTFSILSNNTLSRAELNYENGSTKNLHYGDILIKFGECINVACEDIPYISDEKIAVKYRASRLQEGDIVFADTAEDTTAGKCAECFNIKEQAIISGLHTIPCHPLFPFSTGYLGYYLNSPAYHNQLLPLMQGTKVVGISKTAMKDTNIFFPDNTDEQKSISNYFQNIDRLINTSQTKLNKLKNIRKACLDKMFPKNGSNIPELRFKGFTKSWEKQQLGDCANIVGGGTPATSNPEYWNGEIDWYSPAEIGKKVFVDKSLRKITKLGLKESSAKLLPIGTVLFSSRAGIGSTAILAKEGTTNQGFQSIIPHKDKLDTYFIFSRTSELKKYGETNGAGSTFIEVSGKQMESMPIINPKIDEQEIIGNFFKNLDNLITKTEQQLNKLKNIKKACLNKMFVNTEDII